MTNNRNKAVKVILLVPAVVWVFFTLLLLAVHLGAFDLFPGEEEQGDLESDGEPPYLL